MNLSKLLSIFFLLTGPVMANNYFHPKLSPDESKLAFYGYVNSVPDIFILDFKTHKVNRLTNTPDNWEIEPRWLDNQTIAYASGKDMGSLRQVKSPIDRPIESLLLKGSMIQFPAGLPSKSNKLIFNRKNANNWQLFLVDLQSGKEKDLGIPMGWIGQQIYWSDKKVLVSNGKKIGLMSFDGKRFEELHSGKNKLSFPVLIEDRNELIFIEQDGKSTDIWLKEINSGALKQLTFDGKAKYSPQWLSNQKWVVYAARKDHSVDILVVDQKGEAIKNFTKSLSW